MTLSQAAKKVNVGLIYGLMKFYSLYEKLRIGSQCHEKLDHYATAERLICIGLHILKAK